MIMQQHSTSIPDDSKSNMQDLMMLTLFAFEITMFNTTAVLPIGKAVMRFVFFSFENNF